MALAALIALWQSPFSARDHEIAFQEYQKRFKPFVAERIAARTFGDRFSLPS